MQRQIFFMHKSKFVCDAAEAFAKHHELSCYTFENLEPFAYLIDDLAPELFYIDLEVIKGDIEQFKTELSKAVKTKPKLILLNPTSEQIDEKKYPDFIETINQKLDLSEIFKRAKSL